MSLYKMFRDLYKILKNFDRYRSLHVHPGHYYSPIVAPEEINNDENRIWKSGDENLTGIDLKLEKQIELLNEFLPFYEEIPFGTEHSENTRYFFENPMYSYADGIFLYSIIRHFKPKRIVEVGSGFSSAVTLDTNELFFDNKIECTFIEPYPERLNSLLKPNESINLIQDKVQNQDPDLFEQLEKDDILFIDSSHVCKTGSDLNYIFFEVLPRLKKGVKIHFHDIFYPFEYPKNWVISKHRSWNEIYLLRAFLTNNNRFSVLLFSSYLTQLHNSWIKEHMPLCLKNTGGNIWLEVVN